MEPRRLQAAKGLLKHSLFGFQVHDPVVLERLDELKELLMATCSERDQIALLSENIREIEEQLQSHSERFLLEPLRRFEQDMELLLDVWSGDDVEEEDGDDEMEDCLSLSQDSVITLSTTQSTPLPFVQPIGLIQKKSEDEEMRCGVCWAPDSLENDPIVICDVCGVAVHQTCYRLAAVPEGDWFCIPCRLYMDSHDIENNLLPTHEIECDACCSKAGAMVPTIDAGWVHVACSMFLPELYIQKEHASKHQGPLDDLHVVCGVDRLKARRKLRCCFCKKNYAKGACAQCAVGKCTVAYHALCALQNGIKLRYLEDRGQFGSGCLKHQAEFLKMDTFNNFGDAIPENSLPLKLKDVNMMGSRKTSWSNIGGSGSDDEKDDDNDLDSDSDCDGSLDSLSEDIFLGFNDNHKSLALSTLTKVSPPRLLGAPSLPNRGKKRFNRPNTKRQIELSFASANVIPLQPTNSVKVAHELPSSRLVTHNVAVDCTTSSRQSAASSKATVTDTDRERIIQANVFIPVFYPYVDGPDYSGHSDSQNYNYVMVLVHSRPLGLGIASSKHGTGIFLLAKNTRNLSVIAALERGVLEDGDEIYALNDLVLRNTELGSFKDEVVPSVSLPVRCWFRTRQKKKLAATVLPLHSTVNDTAAHTEIVNLAHPAVPREQQFKTPLATASPHFGNNINFANSSQNICNDDAKNASLGIDWPWVFLRSDGKVAMNLFWKSLDSAYFLKKFDKRTFIKLQERTENMCGVRLNSSHPEYEQVRELFLMPRRERVPAYLVEYRKSLNCKHDSDKSDVLIGISSEPNDAENEVDKQSLLEVGTTVNVAKRTWPGMNKLGGVGRIKKVNKVMIPDGKITYTYNIAYVLSGTEKNVERKYISVVDLEADKTDKNKEINSTLASRRHKSEVEADIKNADEKGTDDVSARLIFVISRAADEDQLTDLLDAQFESLPNRQRFQVQFTIDNSAVRCDRKMQHLGLAPPAQELLLHRYFPVKVADALVNKYFSSVLLSVEDRIGDEVDEANSDSENDADEIKTELTFLQKQLCSVMESNESAFASLTESIEKEYASKVYRQEELQDIEWRNYERMYQELHAAKRQFAHSDEESDLSEDGRQSDFAAKTLSRDGMISDNEDISFGGMFVNKLKQEGSDVCALCELSGGDFTRTESDSIVHPQCALFTPETFFKDGVVHGMNLVDPNRQRLKCAICGGRKGRSKVQCAHRKCVRAYHVSCAFVNGLLTKDPYYQAWCPRHLKTSGMGHFVEFPDHLDKDGIPLATASTSNNILKPNLSSSSAQRGRRGRKQRSSQPRKSHSFKDTTLAEAVTPTQADILLSKSNRKRKRTCGSTSVGSLKDLRVTRGKSPRSAIARDEGEPRCARRLEIELSDDSDYEGRAVDAWQLGRDPLHVFSEGSVVEVLARDWRGSNKPGGVARVRGVEMVEKKAGIKEAFYDVVHIVGAFKEKRVPAKFVRSYHSTS